MPTTQSVPPVRWGVLSALCLVAVPAAADLACGSDASTSITQVTVTGNLRTVQSSGCPGYSWASQKSNITPTFQCNSYVFPALPVISTSVYYIGLYINGTKKNINPNQTTGPVGVSVNGVSLYANGDGNKTDAYLSEQSSLDSCGGFTGAGGEYHYRGLTGPGCAYSDTKGTGHSPLYGIMADGIPLFGPYGDKGVVPKDLDECNGHTDSSYGFYHYHVHSNYTYPYLINCIKGCLNGSNLITGQSCAPAAKQYDYSALSKLTNLTRKFGSFYCNILAGTTTTPYLSGSPPRLGITLGNSWLAWATAGAVLLAFSG